MGGRGRKAACGGVGWHRRRGEAQRFIVYLIEAGLLPVRFRPPIGRAVGRWPEGEGGCSDRTQPSLTRVGAAPWAARRAALMEWTPPSTLRHRDVPR